MRELINVCFKGNEQHAKITRRNAFWKGNKEKDRMTFDEIFAKLAMNYLIGNYYLTSDYVCFP